MERLFSSAILQTGDNEWYIIAGSSHTADSIKVSETVMRANLGPKGEVLTLTKLALLPGGNMQGHAIEKDGNIYVVGGRDSNYGKFYTKKYSIREDKWTSIALGNKS
jgi:hypothetical protein